MPKFAAVGGKSGTARIVSVHAETKDAARAEITRQLMSNAQRREIWQQWQASGAAIVSEVLEDEFDEAQAEAISDGTIRATMRREEREFVELDTCELDHTALAEWAWRTLEPNADPTNPVPQRYLDIARKLAEEARTPTTPFDEAQANALIRGRLRELLAELKEWNSVTVPPAVYAAFDRARDALKAFDQAVVA